MEGSKNLVDVVKVTNLLQVLNQKLPPFWQQGKMTSSLIIWIKIQRAKRLLYLQLNRLTCKNRMLYRLIQSLEPNKTSSRYSVIFSSITTLMEVAANALISTGLLQTKLIGKRGLRVRIFRNIKRRLRFTIIITIMCITI